MTYDPFDSTPLADLDAERLGVLAEIPEGWFIEYKRDPCKLSDYAKEVSAFANSHGGWMFVGLGEKSNSDRTPVGPGSRPQRQVLGTVHGPRETSPSRHNVSGPATEETLGCPTSSRSCRIRGTELRRRIA